MPHPHSGGTEKKENKMKIEKLEKQFLSASFRGKEKTQLDAGPKTRRRFLNAD